MLPNDLATRLGGAILTGGGGISRPFANLPAEILTRHLFQYRFFDFASPLPDDIGRSLTAGTGLPGSVRSSLDIVSTANSNVDYTMGWQTTLIGGATLTANSGAIAGALEWGDALAMSPGSVNNTGWYSTLSGASANGGTGVAGSICLGQRGYPKKIAFGGSLIQTLGLGTRPTTFFGLSVSGAGLVTAPGVFAASNGLVFELDPDGTVYVVGRRASAGTKTRVSGMSYTLPDALNTFRRIEFVVAAEYTNAGTNTVFPEVEVYLRDYAIAAVGSTGSVVRPPGAFRRFTINAQNATAIPLPAHLSATSNAAYPFIATCNQAGSNADTLDYHFCDNFWYAVERS